MGGASRMPAPRLNTHCPLTCDPIHGENSPFCRAARRPGPLERQGQVLHRHVAPARWQTYVVWWRQQTKNRSVGARPDPCCSNTAALDIAPHPAMSVPCGLSDGLPIGTMLAGKQYDESAIYRAAFAFEQAKDWTMMQADLHLSRRRCHEWCRVAMP